MIGLVWAVLGVIFGAGGALATNRIKVRKNQTDITGVANKVRGESERSDRRWKLWIAGEVEQLEPKEKAQRIARWIRDDAR